MRVMEGHVMLPSKLNPTYTCTACLCEAEFWRDETFPYSHVRILDPGNGSIHRIQDHYFYETSRGSKL